MSKYVEATAYQVQGKVPYVLDNLLDENDIKKNMAVDDLFFKIDKNVSELMDLRVVNNVQFDAIKMDGTVKLLINEEYAKLFNESHIGIKKLKNYVLEGVLKLELYAYPSMLDENSGNFYVLSDIEPKKIEAYLDFEEIKKYSLGNQMLMSIYGIFNDPTISFDNFVERYLSIYPENNYISFETVLSDVTKTLKK